VRRAWVLGMYVVLVDTIVVASCVLAVLKEQALFTRTPSNAGGLVLCF